MFNYVKTPFNIDLLVLEKEHIRNLGEVKTGRIMIPSTQDFDPEGIYSTEIFGPVGSEERATRFGYIDLKVDILHPLVFNHIQSMKVFYKEIMAGKKYAVFNEKTKDFELSNIQDGKTGYHFFFQHFKKVKLKDTDGTQRKFKIDIINFYKKLNKPFNKLLVLPAGLRDYTLTADGRPSEDEVNDLYRKVISLTNNFDNVNIKKEENLYLMSNIMYKLQVAVLDIYEYFFNLLNGKSKFTEGKWAKRAISHGTRNVLTPAVPAIQDINDKNRITLDMTVVGLYQYVKAVTPLTINKVLNKFIYRIMSPDTNTGILVDLKTLKSVTVDIPIKKRDDWITGEGLEQTMNKLGQESLRSLPIMVDKYYLLNIYDDGKTIKPVFNTSELNEEEFKHIRPITYAELFYLAIEDIVDKYPALVTRYPVANVGGVYPSKVYLRTTMNPRTVNYVLNGVSKTLKEYPNLKEKYFNGMSPHSTHLVLLGGD